MPGRKSLWVRHKERWSEGCGHEACSKAFRVVLAKGKIPADIALVGEGPGRSEDSIGLPFVGPAGQLLDKIVGKAIPEAYRVVYLNMVGCIPLGYGGKDKEPSEDQVEACKGRVEEMLALAHPKILIAVGAFAKGYLEQGYAHSLRVPDTVKVFGSIDHPAYILKTNVAQRGLLIQRAIVNITGYIEEYEDLVKG
jgi:uracil-DNA glycosylase family 4